MIKRKNEEAHQMDIHTIRMELRTKSIYDLPLRVT